jgi:hypothetical protein
MTENPNIEQVVNYLRALLPDIDAVISLMEKDGGWLRLARFSALTPYDSGESVSPVLRNRT